MLNFFLIEGTSSDPNGDVKEKGNRLVSTPTTFDDFFFRRPLHAFDVGDVCVGIIGCQVHKATRQW